MGDPLPQSSRAPAAPPPREVFVESLDPAGPVCVNGIEAPNSLADFRYE